MKLELRKDTAGTHFVVCVISEASRKQIVIPLSPSLSEEIDLMVKMEGIRLEGLILPPKMRSS